jgi:hypothetical protein
MVDATVGVEDEALILIVATHNVLPYGESEVVKSVVGHSYAVAQLCVVAGELVSIEKGNAIPCAEPDEASIVLNKI